MSKSKHTIKQVLRRSLDKFPVVKGLIFSVIGKSYPIFLDYPVSSQHRYGYGKPCHGKLYDIINNNRTAYNEYLVFFLKFKNYFLSIAKESEDGSLEPAWLNEWFSGLDAVALYSFLCLNNPKRYFEIGSGDSTKFAKRAIKDHNLKTRITSFDPHPRTDIDLICDNIVRQPIEKVDLGVFDELEKDDILFVDNSHRILMNSDATVVFLDILPRLKAGVFVQFHDIVLPLDYPPAWMGRYYSEQYLLAAYLLAEGKKFEIILPNAFIDGDLALSALVSSLFESPAMVGLPRDGRSFWIRIN